MINKTLPEIYKSMEKGLAEVDFWNWDKSFASAKSKAVFTTSFFRNGFNFSVTITATEK